MEELWKLKNFEPPTISYAVNVKNGDTFLVIEDDSTIYRLINKDGIIYAIAAFRCEKNTSPDFLKGTPFYSIQNPVLHVVLCSKIESEKDIYAIELSKEYLR